MSPRIRIEKLIGGGLGLTHHEDRPWMVSGALPGETVEAEASRRKGSIQFATTRGVVSDRHPARDPDPCIHSTVCGGCDWAHVSVESGAALKAEVAAEAARGFPELSARLRESSVRSSVPRSRVRARVHWDPAKKRVGFCAPQSWSVAEMSTCRVVSPTLLDRIPALESALAERSCESVDLEWLENLDGNRAVFALRPGSNGPQFIKEDWLPNRSQLDEQICGGFILDRKGIHRRGWGSPSISMDLPIPLTVPIGAFFQGNRPLLRWLFDRVGQLVGDDPLPTWDLHAGVGFLGAAALHSAPRDLVAVEPFRPAAEAARENLPTAEVIVGETAESYIEGASNLDPNAAIIADPPRTGLSKKLRSQLIEWAPQRIVMLACDPATWARDTALLLGKGYELTNLELADLFPSTHHVEVIAVLEKC